MRGLSPPFSMELSTPSPSTELQAPAHWRCVDLISDLHLQAADPLTFEGFRAWLQGPLQGRADALFILGDLFEVWVGDDALDQPSAHAFPQDERAFWRRCADVLQTFSQHTPVYFIHGNRDFLLGAGGLTRCGMQPLPDPTVLIFQGQRYLLSHGDALCLDDTDYMRFRASVRQDTWQADFLARPLEEREALAREMRRQSESRQSAQAGQPAPWADVDAAAARKVLTDSRCSVLVHGHTHRPAVHELGSGLCRWVLSDWDLGAVPARAEVLRIDAQGPHRRPLSPPITA